MTQIENPSQPSSSTSIRVEGVAKEFSLQYHRTLKQIMMAKMRREQVSDKFWALNDVSFEVPQGQSIGLMGLNGSGKSTLLKLITGVMKPDQGKVWTRGRISGLIATGAGFHQQATGRENIFMNAAILGMSEEETNAKFDDIAAFADVGRFMDTPVGNYSSGMSSRLGFSVAVHVDCDIFVADEVLAVGDRPFKKKCIRRMNDIRDSGITMFYVSHASGSIKKMCDRVIVLEKGRVGYDGPVNAGIKFLEGEDPDEMDAEEMADEELASDI